MNSVIAASPFKVKLSFEHVIAKLENIASSVDHPRLAEARLLLEEVALHPELREGITSDQQVENNAGLLQRLLSEYFPQELTRNEIKGVSLPFRKKIFNHTERFKSILAAAGEGFEINIRDFDEHQSYVLSCCIILNEFYGTHLDFGKPLFYDIPTAKGVIRHYRIMYNADYLEINPTSQSLQITQDDIDLLMDSYDNLPLWKEKFPEGSWELSGFSLITLFDATIENAVSLFKEKLLVLNARDFQLSVESIFRSIYQSPGIRVGFTVFSREEGRFKIANFGHRMKSYILNDDERSCDEGMFCVNSFNHLIKENTFFAISDTSAYKRSAPKAGLADIFMDQQIESFILAPVVKNNQLLGVLELVSPEKHELNSINANKLEVVMPFLTDSIDRLVSDLGNQVQAFIQENYTTIHRSVYWKFREEAERVIVDQLEGQEPLFNEIVFPDVYPLYGQIDIKGSSEARNTSVQADLKSQLESLLQLLTDIMVIAPEESFPEEELQLKAFLSDLIMPLRANTEQLIHNYVVSKVHRYLRGLTNPALREIIGRYFQEDDKISGSFHTHRRKYEITINTINEKLALVIDKRQAEAQAIFPHYYERFKTDGIEHNLYIGSSISPSSAFDQDDLRRLRLWQIRVLCEMERKHHELKPSLPYQLEVTTLILIYNTAIDIRFRMDEKRFDIDGSYNARFEIVKKRIDKALIKDTFERITAPGKITIVYSSDTEEDEYIRYVKVLQAEGLLEEKVELYEVEDLQGVSGLKALRATIIH